MLVTSHSNNFDSRQIPTQNYIHKNSSHSILNSQSHSHQSHQSNHSYHVQNRNNTQKYSSFSR